MDIGSREYEELMRRFEITGKRISRINRSNFNPVTVLKLMASSSIKDDEAPRLLEEACHAMIAREADNV